MMIPIGPFDAVELVNFAFRLIAFIFVYKAYKKDVNNTISRKFWTYFLLIAAFVLLAKIFDIIDDFAFESYFNLLQHLSSIFVAVVFALAGKNILKGGMRG